jgi:hypothetical protein
MAKLIVNTSEFRAFDVQGAGGSQWVRTPEVCQWAGERLYDPKVDKWIAFGDWCDEYMIDFGSIAQREVLNSFMRGWEIGQQRWDRVRFGG